MEVAKVKGAVLLVFHEMGVNFHGDTAIGPSPKFKGRSNRSLMVHRLSLDQHSREGS